MRTYVFTRKERELLESWLRGELHRRDNAHLDVTLSLVNRYKYKLLDKLHLLIKLLRKLS